MKKYYITHTEKLVLDTFVDNEYATSRELAKILNISHRTVDTHLANIRLKTESINRQQLLDLYIECKECFTTDKKPFSKL